MFGKNVTDWNDFHNMTLFKMICVLYQCHHWTLPIMKIDRDRFQFREYVSTGTEP